MNKVAKKLLAILYFGMLAYTVFFARRRRGGNNYREHINLEPIKKKVHFFLENGFKWNEQHYSFWEDFLGNIIIFIPFAFAVYFLTGRLHRVRNMVLLCFLVSAGIEIVQYVFAVGVFDVDDVLLNMAGGAIGTKLLQMLVLISKKKPKA